jgi:hypothetical protein
VTVGGVQCGAMNNFAVQAVYWFLFAIALLFAAAGLWQVYRITSAQPLQVRILDRTVKIELRELSAKRGTYKALIAVAELRLERLDNRAVVTMTDENQVKKEELVSLSFLERWEQGTLIPAAASDGKLELNPPNPWAIAGAFGVGFWMFGTFAWMARSFATDEAFGSVGLKILVLALLPIGVAAYAIWANLSAEKAEQALERMPVEAELKEFRVRDFIADLERRGVATGAGVTDFLGGPDDTIHFGEFTWEGRTVRSAEAYGAVGERIKGRSNPGNPHDVKWGDQP